MSRRSPVMVVQVHDKSVSDFQPTTSLPIVSLHRDDFATVHDHLAPTTLITESNVPVRTMVEHYESRVRDLEQEVQAQKARHDRAERTLAEMHGILREHSLTLTSLKEKLGVD
jgi:hypothetical protein